MSKTNLRRVLVTVFSVAALAQAGTAFAMNAGGGPGADTVETTAMNAGGGPG